jgi:MFS transporter, PHS family, inorganic phosphate transporter
MIGAVFAMQGFGQFAASMMTLIVVAAFRSALEPVKTPAACVEECQRSVDIMWRIVIGVGGVPGLFALYYRLTIPETPRYTFDVVHDLDQATANVSSWRSGGIGEGWTNPMRRVQVMQDVKRKYHSPQPTYTDLKAYYRKRRNALALFGTAGSWFFLDVAFYGLGLNSSTILSTIGYGGNQNVYRNLYNAAVGNLILVCAGAIPGYWCTVATVDFLGRKTIQISGFVILTILFAIIGFDFHNLSERSLLVLYVLCQFFFNFGKLASLLPPPSGSCSLLSQRLKPLNHDLHIYSRLMLPGPNATTFIIPAECFPTRFRATAHGFSAAAGKVGAIIAQVVFAPMAQRGHKSHPATSAPWLNHVMQIFALFMLCGIGTSLLVPETRRETLEKLADGEEGVDHFELNFVERFFTPFGRATLRDRRGQTERIRWWSWKWWSERRRRKLEEKRLTRRIRTLENARLEARRHADIEIPFHD